MKKNHVKKASLSTFINSTVQSTKAIKGGADEDAIIIADLISG